jgi:hypothetical protein
MADVSNPEEIMTMPVPAGGWTAHYGHAAEGNSVWAYGPTEQEARANLLDLIEPARAVNVLGRVDRRGAALGGAGLILQARDDFAASAAGWRRR